MPSHVVLFRDQGRAYLLKTWLLAPFVKWKLFQTLFLFAREPFWLSFFSVFPPIKIFFSLTLFNEGGFSLQNVGIIYWIIASWSLKIVIMQWKLFTLIFTLQYKVWIGLSSIQWMKQVSVHVISKGYWTHFIAKCPWNPITRPKKLSSFQLPDWCCISL